MSTCLSYSQFTLVYRLLTPGAREHWSIAHVQPWWSKQCLARSCSLGQEAAVGCSVGKCGAVLAMVGGSSVQWDSAVTEKFRRTVERKGGPGVAFTWWQHTRCWQLPASFLLWHPEVLLLSTHQGCIFFSLPQEFSQHPAVTTQRGLWLQVQS